MIGLNIQAPTAGGEAQLSLLHATWRWGWCQSGITHSYKNPAGCYLGQSRIVDGLLNPTKSWDNHKNWCEARVDPTLPRFDRFGLGTIVLQFPRAWGTKIDFEKFFFFWCVKLCPKDSNSRSRKEIPGGSFFFSMDFLWSVDFHMVVRHIKGFTNCLLECCLTNVMLKPPGHSLTEALFGSEKRVISQPGFTSMGSL